MIPHFYFDIPSLDELFGQFHLSDWASLAVVVLRVLILLIPALRRLAKRDDRSNTQPPMVSAHSAEPVLHDFVYSDELKIVKDGGKVIAERKTYVQEVSPLYEELLGLLERDRLIRRFPRIRHSKAKCRTVLLVDDEKAMHVYKDIIEDSFPGTEVRLANSGAEALVEIARERPCIVVTDLIMPVLNGYELIQRLIREHPKVAVIAVSGYADGPARIVQKVGALPQRFDFLRKPLTSGKLVASISRFSEEKQTPNRRSAAI